MDLMKGVLNKLLPELTMNRSDILDIKRAMCDEDALCMDLNLVQVESLWYQYSDDYCASCLIVYENTILNFIDWLRWEGL